MGGGLSDCGGLQHRVLLVAVGEDVFVSGITCKAGVSNIGPGGQNQSTSNSNTAHWTALESVKENINYGQFF